mmetsp:Transcript_24067/g.64556  ORF Transcript_24067/g.64556 Transcript_24067/m.64556 type:complete len:238 (+) Transcript_24067:662-1375(+)
MEAVRAAGAAAAALELAAMKVVMTAEVEVVARESAMMAATMATTTAATTAVVARAAEAAKAVVQVLDAREAAPWEGAGTVWVAWVKLAMVMVAAMMVGANVWVAEMRAREAARAGTATAAVAAATATSAAGATTGRKCTHIALPKMGRCSCPRHCAMRSWDGCLLCRKRLRAATMAPEVVVWGGAAKETSALMATRVEAATVASSTCCSIRSRSLCCPSATASRPGCSRPGHLRSTT